MLPVFDFRGGHGPRGSNNNIARPIHNVNVSNVPTQATHSLSHTHTHTLLHSLMASLDHLCIMALEEVFHGLPGEAIAEVDVWAGDLVVAMDLEAGLQLKVMVTGELEKLPSLDWI